MRKYIKESYLKKKKVNYRSLSEPIILTMKILNITRAAPVSGKLYMDKVIDVNINNFILKISYLDVEEIKNFFAPDD